MKPIVTTSEMRDIDARASEPVGVLIELAGSAVARIAVSMLGGTYGRRVVVVAGKGNNGADGRAAARRLSARGIRVAIVDALAAPATLPRAHLVIDAAYGTGFHGEYRAPATAGAPVLAVDIPSGVNGDTGAAAAGAVRATRTVTFAALKPGLLLGDGPERAGEVDIADIGLDASAAHAHLVEDSDVARTIPPKPRDSHKWNRAVYVVAGSPGMLGAASLASTAALRSGAGLVRLGTPGAAATDYPPSEVVGRVLPEDWPGAVLEDASRCQVIAIGPGIGRSENSVLGVHRLVASSELALVVDADGLGALAQLGTNGIASLARRRARPIVLTPHEGEFARLSGSPPAQDRIDSVRALAAATATTVLLKGSTTIVAAPDGRVLVANAGTGQLATAGTGDVLTGVIAAFLAAGVAPLESAALAAHVHGRAATLGPAVGLVAGDLLALIPRWLSALGEAGVG